MADESTPFVTIASFLECDCQANVDENFGRLVALLNQLYELASASTGETNPQV